VATPVPAIAQAKVERAPVVPATRTSAASRAPKEGSFVVQVASLRSRGEADAIARRLSSKGFPSFVTTPGSGGPRVYRVRVGKFIDRREAETVARRLEKEEQFKPWITR
jgi:cell division septation protein DedD